MYLIYTRVIRNIYDGLRIRVKIVFIEINVSLLIIVYN